jgi:hypothetical protein
MGMGAGLTDAESDFEMMDPHTEIRALPTTTAKGLKHVGSVADLPKAWAGTGDVSDSDSDVEWDRADARPRRLTRTQSHHDK